MGSVSLNEDSSNYLCMKVGRHIHGVELLDVFMLLCMIGNCISFSLLLSKSGYPWKSKNLLPK